MLIFWSVCFVLVERLEERLQAAEKRPMLLGPKGLKGEVGDRGIEVIYLSFDGDIAKFKETNFENLGP